MKLTLTILRETFLVLQVCTNAKKKSDIERLANVRPCGTKNGWGLDEKESKRLGQEKVVCADDETRSHYILYA